MSDESLLLLLVGQTAIAVAPRLTASGYVTVDWLSAGVTSGCGSAESSDSPLAAILSADQADLIPDLRHRFGAMPILLDLEQDGVEARSACLRSGADDFWLSFTGPSDLLLRLRLHRSLRQRQLQRPPLMQFDDLILDPFTHQVHRGSRAVELTVREFALLRTLLGRCGHVFSREELLQEVWSDERAASRNVVEVYVRYLRQKLEAGGELRLLHTVRGRGYCLGTQVPGG